MLFDKNKNWSNRKVWSLFWYERWIAGSVALCYFLPTRARIDWSKTHVIASPTVDKIIPQKHYNFAGSKDFFRAPKKSRKPAAISSKTFRKHKIGWWKIDNGNPAGDVAEKIVWVPTTKALQVVFWGFHQRKLVSPNFSSKYFYI